MAWLVLAMGLAGCAGDLPVIPGEGTSAGSSTGDDGLAETGSSGLATTGTSGDAESGESSDTGIEPGCGNGIVEAGETCDEQGATATCDEDCTPVDCGDGEVNAAAGEQCDDGGAAETCNLDCTLPRCGDGEINVEGEACDDGVASAFCDEDCTLAECGDGVLNVLAGGSIGFDPKEGEKDKECQLGAKIAANTPGVMKPDDAVPSNDSDWIHCAVHGQQCNMDGIGLGVALLAYGNGTDWTTLLTNAPVAYCHNGQIGFDPKEGVGKDCYYRRLPSTAKTTGRWVERVAHGSPSGGEVSFGIQHGLEVSEGTSSTTGWSTEFSYSQTTGIGLKVAGAGSETNTTYSATFGLEHSTEISTAVSKSTVETTDVSCAVPENSNVKLYQFATDTEVACIDAGECKATAYLLMSQCILNPPADYLGPQCFPGECDPNDPLCLTCRTM